MLDNQRMLAEQRRGVILEELGRIGSVSVADLSRRLGVSDMTIRRDLEDLSGRGLLRKVHGGAIPVSRSAEPHFEQKRRLNRTEKLAIARAAKDFVLDGDTVAFSAGTTPWHVASILYPGHMDLSFVTNSTNVALTLQENGWERILLSGGMFRTPSDALVGPFADRTLRTLNADVLFLGARSTPGRGPHHPQHRRGGDQRLPHRRGQEGRGRGRQFQARRRSPGQDHPPLQGRCLR